MVSKNVVPLVKVLKNVKKDTQIIPVQGGNPSGF